MKLEHIDTVHHLIISFLGGYNEFMEIRFRIGS